MVSKGKVTLKGKETVYFKLTQKVSVFGKPKIMLESPETFTCIRVVLVMNKVVQYDTAEVSLRMGRNTLMFDWDKMKIHEFSPKYFNGIILRSGMGFTTTLNYEFEVRVEEKIAI